MNENSLFYLYIVNDYEYSEIMYTNKNKVLNNRIGTNLFNIMNNKVYIIDLLKEYTEKFLDLSNKILDYSSCRTLLNLLLRDLEKKGINSFISNLIYHDLIKISKSNIDNFKNMNKNLLKEKYDLSQFNKLIANRDENGINNYIIKNQYNYDDENTYKKLLNSDIETKILEMKQEIIFCENNIRYYETELDPITVLAKSNLNIQSYVKVLETRFEVFSLFFSKKFLQQKQNIKNIFKKVLMSKIKIPSSIINYAIIDNNILKNIKIKDVKRTDVELFSKYNPYIIYNIDTINDLFNVYIKYFIENNTKILMCKNCGKYFISKGNQMYCDNVYHNNKSCKQLSGDMKKNNDTIYVLYRNNYKTQFNKMNRNKNNIPNIKNRFNTWNNIAKEKVKECKNEIISFDELKEWFKTHQDWHKK